MQGKENFLLYCVYLKSFYFDGIIVHACEICIETQAQTIQASSEIYSK